MALHYFHMVSVSPWPLLSSFSALALILSMVSAMSTKFWLPVFCYFTILSMIAFCWWRDVIRESTYIGDHSLQVIKGLKIGMILFILSEVMFFASFFWGFFQSSLAPNIEIGLQWPPMGIIMFNPWQIPLLNTLLLLSSGMTVTWAHHAILNKNLPSSFIALLATISLGGLFSFLQGFEYLTALFCISDGVFGSCFFMATGFHGLHVLIGTLFLSVGLFRLVSLQFNPSHHFGFEAAAWYWHFVDVVWIFLFTFVYWWPSHF